MPAGSASTQSTRRSTHLYSSNHHKRHPLSSSKDLLPNSNDWEFLFDLGDSQLVFPPEIAVTTQRPDIVIFSRSKKAVLLVELTVPLEDRVAAGHTRKENRYAGLVQQCTENGWFARCFAVEVGCLGYVSPSLFHCLESLGIPSSTSRKLRNVVVSLTGVVMCSSSAEAVWTGLPGPWVDLSTFLKGKFAGK